MLRERSEGGDGLGFSKLAKERLTKDGASICLWIPLGRLENGLLVLFLG
ncbi:MAG TPA: hypothetical protein VOA87_20730 [Thermoanaerobaculia bacterium]|nr:hypothetical protein [Thermoanaerobaculia bacterium]